MSTVKFQFLQEETEALTADKGLHYSTSSSESNTLIAVSVPNKRSNIIDTAKEEGVDVGFKRDVLLNESFEHYTNIQAQIIGIGSKSIQCKCLLDSEKKIFKQKAFKRILFQNLVKIELNAFVLISIKEKAGSVRFDLYPGEQFVNKALFDDDSDDSEIEAIWATVNADKLMKPMDYKIK